MSIAALVCKVAIGVGSVTALPGVVQSPRYDGAELRIEFTESGELADIMVTGPFDKAGSYRDQGLSLLAVRSDGVLVIEASLVGLNPIRETLLITSSGSLLWTQISHAQEVRASSASLFTGHCETEILKL